VMETGKHLKAEVERQNKKKGYVDIRTARRLVRRIQYLEEWSAQHTGTIPGEEYPTNILSLDPGKRYKMSVTTFPSGSHGIIMEEVN